MSSQLKIDSRMIESIRKHHPMQYGFRGTEIVFDPGDDETVSERYNRCPKCEEWSPCDVRVFLESVVSNPICVEVLQIRIKE